ncbi:hypothetical protein H671_2g4842 [Cricetulus griseus]|nr:hypothetical protein H671_2g4842 [Cricetulus griseus]
MATVLSSEKADSVMTHIRDGNRHRKPQLVTLQQAIDNEMSAPNGYICNTISATKSQGTLCSIGLKDCKRKKTPKLSVKLCHLK